MKQICYYYHNYYYDYYLYINISRVMYLYALTAVLVPVFN